MTPESVRALLLILPNNWARIDTNIPTGHYTSTTNTRCRCKSDAPRPLATETETVGGVGATIMHDGSGVFFIYLL